MRVEMAKLRRNRKLVNLEDHEDWKLAGLPQQFDDAGALWHIKERISRGFCPFNHRLWVTPMEQISTPWFISRDRHERCFPAYGGTRQLL